MSPAKNSLSTSSGGRLLHSLQAEQVVEAQKMRIVQMLLKGKTYGLPGSDGKVSLFQLSTLLNRLPS